MPRSNGPLRLFVAAHPPPEGQQYLLDALSALELAPHRPTPVEQVHLTLQFIGNVPPGEVEEVVESVERAASGIETFTLTPLRLVTLPEKGPPRLVAAITNAPPPLLELHRRLALRLARKPRRDAADRYLPHLTLCRFRGDVRASRVEQTLDAPSFRIDRVALMRSVLLPAGSEHREVHAVPLGREEGKGPVGPV